MQRVEQGEAANVQAAQNRVERAKKEQAEALKNQKKAQREQLIIDTISQTSNLVTAAAKIWSQVGFPFAIPAIALMFGSFAAAKIKAFELSSKQAKHGHFQVIGNGTHASGNDTPLGIKTDDGRQLVVEQKEGLGVFSSKSMKHYGHKMV